MTIQEIRDPIYTCDVCTTKITQEVTVVDFKAFICSVTCLAKYQENYSEQDRFEARVIKFPVSNEIHKVVSLNKVNLLGKK